MLVLIVLVNLVFFATYEIISWSGSDQAGKCLSFAVEQLLNPYSLWTNSYLENAQDFIAADIMIYRVLATFQSTFSALLVAALMWSIQVRFRIF